MLDADFTIDALLDRAKAFEGRLAGLRDSAAEDAPAWYPYGSVVDAVYMMTQFLSEGHRDLRPFLGAGAVVDVAAADGELAFFFESLGCRATIVADSDSPPPARSRRLKAALGSSADVLVADLDGGEMFPGWFDMAFFFGTLFHFRNPLGVLARLARRSRHCMLSTRVFRQISNVPLGEYPVAYLLDAYEASNDPTCYWVFTEAGLRRTVGRVGWEVLDYWTFGNTTNSDPSSSQGDERAFCLLRSGLT